MFGLNCKITTSGTLAAAGEAIMLDAMYELPSDKNQKEHKVTLRYAKDKFKNSKLSNLKVA